MRDAKKVLYLTPTWLVGWVKVKCEDICKNYTSPSHADDLQEF